MSGEVWPVRGHAGAVTAVLLSLAAVTWAQEGGAPQSSAKRYFPPCPAFGPELELDCYHDFSEVERFVRDRFAGKKPPQNFNVWSVGCSSGEEPYSLAMMLTELFASLQVNPYWGITATDISLPVLAKARKGHYPVRKVDLVDPLLKERYFRRASDREYEIAAELKARICFARVNVLELHQVPFQDLDLIYCQNMLIYFRRWRKREIVTRLADRLAPGGMMVLGLGEVVDWQHPTVDRVRFDDTLAYMRRMQ